MARLDKRRPRNWSRAQEAKRVDAERWRALCHLVDDARYFLPRYQAAGRQDEATLAKSLIKQYGDVVDLIREEVHPDTFGGHPWSRRLWSRYLSVVKSFKENYL